MISRKIWVIEKLWDFHTVRCTQIWISHKRGLLKMNSFLYVISRFLYQVGNTEERGVERIYGGVRSTSMVAPLLSFLVLLLSISPKLKKKNCSPPLWASAAITFVCSSPLFGAHSVWRTFRGAASPKKRVLGVGNLRECYPWNPWGSISLTIFWKIAPHHPLIISLATPLRTL